MSIPPRDPGPRIDALEERANSTDEYLHHVLSHEVAAVRGAVGIVHSHQQAMRAEVTRTGQHLDQVAAEVSTVARSQIEHGAALAQLAGKVEGLDRKVDSHGEMLAEILRRLPAAPE
jgi:hypothetical protein